MMTLKGSLKEDYSPGAASGPEAANSVSRAKPRRRDRLGGDKYSRTYLQYKAGTIRV